MVMNFGEIHFSLQDLSRYIETLEISKVLTWNVVLLGNHAIGF